MPISQEDHDAILQVRNTISLQRTGRNLQDSFEEAQHKNEKDHLREALQDNRITIDAEDAEKIIAKAQELKDEPASFKRSENSVKQVGVALKNSLEHAPSHHKAVASALAVGSLLALWQGDYKSLTFLAATGIGTVLGKAVMDSVSCQSAMHKVNRFFDHNKQQTDSVSLSRTENKMTV